MKTKYRIAAYVRISNEDENVGESNSIKNQRDLIIDFINNNEELENSLIFEFCDDGYSGTNFNRPGISKLLDGIKNGDINCVVVKDLSRFGRNYIENGEYLEHIFPYLGVRFISVNDNYDSMKNMRANQGLEIAFKNMIHDFYSKDLSQKVMKAKRAKMAIGSYISPYAPFGYIKSPNNKNLLIIDEVAAKVVKQLFSMALVGYTTTQIAQKLNEEKIPTPLIYKKYKLPNRNWNVVNEENFWTRESVRRILRDERYTGKMVSGKRKRIEVGNRKTKKLSKPDWFIISNTHEAIIDEEKFQKVQELIKISKIRNITFDENRPLYGKVKCGYCKHSMRWRNASTPYYYCITSNYVNDYECKSVRICENIVEELVLSSIKKQIAILVDKRKVEDKRKNEEISNAVNIAEQIKVLKREIEKLKFQKLDEYEKYKEEKISRDQYLKNKDDIFSKSEILVDQSIKLEKELQRLTGKRDQSIDSLSKFKTFEFLDKLTRELVVQLIDTVYLYEDKAIEIIWNFKDEYSEKINL
jgi:site-specific DNA recombinase